MIKVCHWQCDYHRAKNKLLLAMHSFLLLQMAEAGFVSLATETEPTAARCFFCCKELDSWHPDDDPRKEDESHSFSCAFNNMTKDFSQLQVQEFLLLELERARFHIVSFGFMFNGNGANSCHICSKCDTSAIPIVTDIC
uniref:Uncharacterized protein n=1 Tax=Eptatretus burgeri TaxID=7764 RepID=A0A8C4WW57_EPTBU